LRAAARKASTSFGVLERARVGAGVLALDAASRAAGQLAGGWSVASDDRGDLLERHAEHVVQHERDALGGRERVENDEQREPDRLGERRLVLGVRPCARAGGWLRHIGAERHLRPRAAGLQDVQAHPREHRGEPAPEVLDGVRV
jgi:hypothetical protein